MAAVGSIPLERLTLWNLLTATRGPYPQRCENDTRCGRRNAAAILASTNPEGFREIIDVLEGFSLTTSDLVNPGGNESKIAAVLNAAFRNNGWREGRFDTEITGSLNIMPYRAADEIKQRVVPRRPATGTRRTSRGSPQGPR